MKFLNTLLPLAVFLLISITSFAQNKNTCIVLNIDAQGIDMDDKQMGNLVRLELDKLEKFEVVDRYDVAHLIEKNDLKIDNCFGKICLLEIGEKLNVKYILTGSTERFGDIIIMTMRLINVKNGAIEKTQVMEYRYLPKEIRTMVNMAIAKLFDLEVSPDLEKKLTKKFDYENALNNPDIDQLNLSGPRMGLTYTMGEAGSILRAPKAQGGFDNYPFYTAFGYQFEIQYLNEGNFQALFEIIPLISGLDQGLIIPSLSLLHGVRNNRNGLEFAFGPIISTVQLANGYYDENGNWMLASEWNIDQMGEPPLLEQRMDSRGKLLRLKTGFVFAVGWTFKSGKLNLPINAFVIPNKNGTRVGVSFGFNAKKNKF